MPYRPESSTVRRRKLAEYVNFFGDIIVKSCSTYSKYKREYRVYIRSGKYSKCIRRGQRYDIQVTQSEQEHLKKEKTKLRQGIKKAYKAQEKARADLQVAFARKMRLRQQMDFLDKRVKDAVSIKESALAEADQEVIDFSQPSEGSALNLSPYTWSALDDLPDGFWDVPVSAVSSRTALVPSGSLLNILQVPKCFPIQGNLSI